MEYLWILVAVVGPLAVFGFTRINDRASIPVCIGYALLTLTMIGVIAAGTWCILLIWSTVTDTPVTIINMVFLIVFAVTATTVGTLALKVTQRYT